MKHILAEGTEFDYVAADESELAVQSAFPGALARHRALAKGSDTRLAYFRSPILDRRNVPYWLVWQSPVDLIDLDRRVGTGHSEDNDFSASFRTRLHVLKCSGCGAFFEVLSVEAGNPYPLVASLHLEKIRKLEVLRCPKCGGSFRQYVAKVIGEVESRHSPD